MLFDKLSALIHSGTQNDKTAEVFFIQLKESLERFEQRDALPIINEAKLKEVIDWADKKDYLQKISTSKEAAEMLVHSIGANIQAGDKELPDALLNNPKIRRALEKSAVKPEEVPEIAELIRTGELFQDIVFTVTRVFKLVLQEFGNLQAIPHLPEIIFKLPRAVISDLKKVEGFNGYFHEFIESLKKGQSPKNPDILDNTLKTLFQIIIIGDVIDTAYDLLSEENQSLRIALLIYARLNGANIEEKDIDKVRELILNRKNPNNPQLGAFLLYVVPELPRLIGK